MKAYAYVLGTIALTVYGQLAIKWRMTVLGGAQPAPLSKLALVGKALLDFYVLSGLLAAFGASLFWMAALSELPLSRAYPCMAASFVLVFVFSVLCGEAFTWGKLAGILCISAGMILSVKF